MMDGNDNPGGCPVMHGATTHTTNRVVERCT